MVFWITLGFGALAIFCQIMALRTVRVRWMLLFIASVLLMLASAYSEPGTRGPWGLW